MAKPVLKKVIFPLIKNRTGLDIENIGNMVEDVREQASKNSKAKHEHDEYYTFLKIIKEARKELRKLAENQTLVIIVDEMDRCLPNYTIKILERLHHLFNDLGNTVLIMALDRLQLDNTIKQIFGEGVDCNAYLKKFIDLEMQLDLGKVNDQFFTKFSDYVALFDESILEHWEGLHDYITALFSGIEVRRQEHLVGRIQTIHKILFGTQEKKDYSFLCFELLLAVLSEHGIVFGAAPMSYKESNQVNYKLAFDKAMPEPLVTYIKSNWIYDVGITHSPSGYGPYFTNKSLDIPQLLIGYCEEVYGLQGVLQNHPGYSKYKTYIKNFKDVKRTLEIIK